MTFRTVLGKTTSFASNIRPITLGAGGKEIGLDDQIGILSLRLEEPESNELLRHGLTAGERKAVFEKAIQAISSHQTTTAMIPNDCVQFVINSHTLFLYQTTGHESPSRSQAAFTSIPTVATGLCKLKMHINRDAPPGLFAHGETLAKSYRIARVTEENWRVTGCGDIDFKNTETHAMCPSIAAADGDRRLLRIAIKVIASVEKMTWGNLINLQYDQTQPSAASQAKEVIDSMLCAAFDPARRCVREGHKLYPPISHEQVQEGFGLVRQQGISRQLHVVGGTLMISEHPCSRLVVKTASAADFMSTFAGKHIIGTSAAEIANAVRPNLRGLRVKLQTEPGKPECTVIGVSVSDATGTTSPTSEMTVAEVCMKRGILLEFPKLPCLNVGTTSQPRFIAPELCRILPNQPFRGTLTRAQQQWIGSFSHELVNLQNSIACSVEPYSTDAEPIVWLDSAVMKRATAAFAFDSQAGSWSRSSFHVDRFKVVFVQIGAEPYKSHLWTRFKEQLSSKITQYGVGVVEKKTIGLKSLDDIASTRSWQHELLPYTLDRDSNRRTVLVFGFDAKGQKGSTSKYIKAMCDADLGVQCLCISTSDLEGSMRREDDGKLNMEHLAGYTLSNIFANNPKPRESDHLLVGLDITELSKPADGVLRMTHEHKRPRDDKWFIVSFSARAAKESANYNTSVSLHKVDKHEGVDLAKIFADFVAKCRDTYGAAHISVYRSGNTIPIAIATPSQESRVRQPGLHADDGGSVRYTKLISPSLLGWGIGPDLHPDEHDVTTLKYKTADAQECPNTSVSSIPRGALDTLTAEADAFAQVLKHDRNESHMRLSYYHVAEDKWSYLSPGARGALTAAFNESVAQRPFCPMDYSERHATFFVTSTDQIELKPHASFEVYRMVRSKTGEAVSDNRRGLRLTVIRHDQGIERTRFGHTTSFKKSLFPQLQPRRQPQPIFFGDPPISSVPPNTPIAGVTSDHRNLVNTEGLTSHFLEPKLIPRLFSSFSQPTTDQRESTSTASMSSDKTAIFGHLVPASPNASASQPATAVVDAATIEPVHAAFHDFRLKKHDTILPVPCYLAGKAAKRAIMRLETDNWDEDNETKPYKLRPAGEKLDGTLYFLN